jgi:hypothetical protein
MPTPRATSTLTPQMRRFLLDGRPSTPDKPLVSGTMISGRWVGLITGGGGGDELVEQAWRINRAELLRAVRPGLPAGWRWFEAPPAQRWPLGQVARAAAAERAAAYPEHALDDVVVGYQDPETDEEDN